MKKLRNDNSGFSNVVIGSLKGLIFAVITFLIFTVIFSLFITKCDVSDMAVEIMSLCSIGVASFVCAFANQRKLKIKGLLSGLLSAGEIFVIVFVLGLFGTNGSFTILMLKKLLVILILGIIGGILAANVRKKYK